jgi:hypothetical protein
MSNCRPTGLFLSETSGRSHFPPAILVEARTPRYSGSNSRWRCFLRISSQSGIRTKCSESMALKPRRWLGYDDHSRRRPRCSRSHCAFSSRFLDYQRCIPPLCGSRSTFSIRRLPRCGGTNRPSQKGWEFGVTSGANSPRSPVRSKSEERYGDFDTPNLGRLSRSIFGVLRVHQVDLADAAEQAAFGRSGGATREG